MNNISFLVLFCFIMSCASREAQTSEEPVTEKPFHFEYSTEAAPEWTNLFYRKSGWFAADGVFSIPLTGVDKPGNEENERTLLIFSDTYIGEVEDNKPLPGNKMVNNTIAYIDGIEPDPENITFHYKQGPDGEPQTFFVPDNENSKQGQYYWLGDGFINKEMEGQLHLFAYHVAKTGPNVFDFDVSNVSLLAVPAPSSPPFEGYQQLTTPFHIEHKNLGTGDLGAGVLVNTEWAGAPNPDGYVYVYGVLGDEKSLVAARTKPAEFEDFEKWRFWNGKDWSPEINEVAEITNSVSNELSVTPLKNGRYLLIFQVMGISDKVGLRVGTSPVGPFGPVNEIWTVPEYNEPPGILPYNAKAHPNLSKPGELLISYNTITFNFWEDIQKNAHIYRPRFFKLKSDALK